VDKETATEREQEAIKESLEEPGVPEAATGESGQAAVPPKKGRRNGYQPQTTQPEWAVAADDALDEQPLQEDQEAPYPDESGDTLEQIRKVAPWVTLTLFAVFPNLLTLGILVVAVALNGAHIFRMARSLKLEHWGYIGLTLLAGGLRFWDLGLKPLHHDESMHAYFSWILYLNPSSYQYNPVLHGPFQFHAIAYVYYVAHGLGTPDGGVTDVTARIAAATMGTLMIPMCYFLRDQIGKVGALIAAFLLAISPTIVYYSRFTREDIYFASFVFITVVALFKYSEERRLRWLLIGLGAFTGAYATKEAAFFNIAMFGGILAGFIAWEVGSRLVYPWAHVQVEQDDVVVSPLQDDAAGTPPAQSRRLRLPFGLNVHAGVPAVLFFLAVAGIAAKVVLNWVQHTSNWIAATDKYSDPNFAKIAADRLATAQATAQNIENVLVSALLIALVLIAVIVLVVVVWQLFTDPYATASEEQDKPFPLALRGGWPLLIPVGLVFVAEVIFRFLAPTVPWELRFVFDFVAVALAVEWLRRVLARWADPVRQPLLYRLVHVPWAHWFFGLLVVFGIFAALFWILPTSDPSRCNGSVPVQAGTICTWTQGFHQGIGDGMVQGIFYWITQQQVERGGQPWYYYLILIPFYEQLVLIFGLGGLVRCLARPTRFRLFVALWFVVSLFLYSWAGEKMPWLTIHIVLPLILLAAIALEWAVVRVLEMLDEIAQNRLASRSAFAGQVLSRSARPLFTLVVAFLLLIPMLHSMLFVTYVDPGDAPHEMLSYVQTTTDVTDVMAKIDALDQKLYGGTHQLKIGLPNSQAIWPFTWYLRDYKYVWYYYDGKNPAPSALDVIITDPGADSVYTTPDASNPQGVFASKEYRIRAWWDQGYMPPACVPSKTKTCDPNAGVGIGVWPWLSYGDPMPCESMNVQNPQVAQQVKQAGVVYCIATTTSGSTFSACKPASQSQTGLACTRVPSFDAGKAFGNFWDWLWTRKPMGPTDGSTDFMFLVRRGLPVQP
jgi:uncharacterized protein (TIGR03663 family)